MRLDAPLVRLPRRYCVDTLAAEVAALPASAWMPHPGRLAGNDAVPLITPGGAITNAFAGPMAPTAHLRACPYIMEIMADLGAVWGRSRLMGLAAAADVPEHVDVGYYWRTHVRIHIPIITTPKVAFTCDGETVHMAAGECWVFDSFRTHNVRNGGTDKRVHLVLDTVGGEGLWDLVTGAQRGDAPDRTLSPGATPTDGLTYEQFNAPQIMSPWEIRCHVDYLVGLTPDSAALAAIVERLDRFVNGWTAAWARFGAAEAGAPVYRRLIDAMRAELLTLRADTVLLTNKVPIGRALNELILQVALPAPPMTLAGGREAIAAAG